MVNGFPKERGICVAYLEISRHGDGLLYVACRLRQYTERGKQGAGRKAAGAGRNGSA